MTRPGEVQRTDRYPIEAEMTYFEALRGDPRKKDFFKQCVNADPSCHQWRAPLDPRSGGSIMLHVRNYNLPSPVDHFDEIVVRMPALAPCRDFFLKNARASPSPRTGHHTTRCSLCSSCWFGYWVNDHYVKNCPIQKLPEADRQKFYFVNTLAFCPQCGGRSHRHDACTYRHPCNRCGVQGHQEQMFICRKNMTPEQVDELVRTTRRNHYKRVSDLNSRGMLNFFIVNDYPDMSLIRARRRGGVYYGYGPYDDDIGEFPPFADSSYRSARRYRGIQAAETNPESLLAVFKITDHEVACEWEQKFRDESARRRGIVQGEKVRVNQNTEVTTQLSPKGVRPTSSSCSSLLEDGEIPDSQEILRSETPPPEPPTKRARAESEKNGFESGENFRKMRRSHVLKVIESVEDHACLWDQSDRDFRDSERKNRLWWDLEKQLGFLKVTKGSTIRNVWGQLVDEFRKEKERQRDSDDVLPKFEYFKRMQFLARRRHTHTGSPSSASRKEHEDICNYVCKTLSRLDGPDGFDLKCEIRELCKKAVAPK